MERVENEYPVVVAMWGAPSTGKTTVAKGIAAKLKCPLISFEYYLDHFVSLRLSDSNPGPPDLFPQSLLSPRPTLRPYHGERLGFIGRPTEEAGILPDLFGKVDARPKPTKEKHCSSSSTPSAADEKSMEAKQLMDHAFRMAIQVAETQLSMGISVIIDSVFLHSYLKQLASLRTSHPGVKIVVVACQPSQRTQWESMFSNRETKTSDRYNWYKPGNPGYLPILSYYYSLDYDFPRVSVLEVNTSDSPDYDKLVRVLRDLSCSRAHRAELGAWKPIHYNENGEGVVGCSLKMDMGRLPYDDATHGMLDFHKKLPNSLEHACGACAETVIDEEAYTCRCGCDLVLHKHCAESSKKEDAAAMDLHTYAKLLQERWLGPEYSFPEKHTCDQCRQTYKDFSYDCAGCFSGTLDEYFKGHWYNVFGCGIVKCYFHDLELEAKPIEHVNRYTCEACGKLGSYSGYSCFYCRIHYHVGCVSLPDSIQHEHGGWEHPMELRLRTPDDEEGYVCDVCYRDIDRQFWYYECKMGCFITHVDCLPPAAAPTREISCSSLDDDKLYSDDDEEGSKISCSSLDDDKLYSDDDEEGSKLPNHLKEPIVRFHIPQGRGRCAKCSAEDDKFYSASGSSFCGNCLFSNLGFEMKPAVVRHRSHGHQQHFLSLWIRPIPEEARAPYQPCFVCGQAVSFCSYKCSKCKLRCHAGCAELPYRIHHQHDGRSRAFARVQIFGTTDHNFECCVCHRRILIGSQEEYKHYYCGEDGGFRAHPQCIAFTDP